MAQKRKGVCQNKKYYKAWKKIQLIHRELANIRQNHLHQTTTSIVKTKPCKIVIEDLNVKGMMKNKYLSDSIRKQCFSEFKKQLEYKTKLRGIELVIADKFYPSSKTCGNCGNIKKDLKLKDRIYKCEYGFIQLRSCPVFSVTTVAFKPLYI